MRFRLDYFANKQYFTTFVTFTITTCSKYDINKF